MNNYEQYCVDNKMKFSKTLQDYRIANGLTQREMAPLLGLSERGYIKYENGEYDEKPKKVAEYTAIFHENISKKTAKSPNSEKTKSQNATPVYDLAATAGGVDYASQLPEQPVFSLTIPGLQDCNFGMYVYGHSMYPVIENGSLKSRKMK